MNQINIRKHWLLFFLLLLSGLVLKAQYHVTIIINNLPAYNQDSDQLYIAGSFNNWNPGQESYRLNNINGHPGITIVVPRGMF
jgi:hypothetical protein